MDEKGKHEATTRHIGRERCKMRDVGRRYGCMYSKDDDVVNVTIQMTLMTPQC